MNKSFCSLAWRGITTDPDGSLRPCCVSTDKILKDDGSEYNLGHDTLDQIYNSNYYRTLRQKMLNGEYVEGCQTCYSNEDNGRESRRLINNNNFADEIFDDNLSIKYMDLRLGNLCNLKCRMCSPMNSSLIEDEYTNEDTVLKKYYLKSNQTDKEWFSRPQFDDNINKHLANLHTLYLTGGEPTLIKKNYEILQRLINLGQHKNVTLIINTNMTNSNHKFYELIKDFKSVIIQMSVDAIGDYANYIRYPSNFANVNETLNDLTNLEGNIKLVAGPVLQILNLNTIVEVFEYFENFNRSAGKALIDIRPGFVYNPHHLNLLYLPKDFKVECYRKIYIWMLEKCQYQSIFFKNFIHALKNKCYEDSMDVTRLKSFMEYNTHLDKLRNMSLEKYNPQLFNVLKSYA